MISSIRGIVSHKATDMVVVVVGGIGIDINTTRNGLEKSFVGEETALTTRLIVREDSLTLYGFATIGERDVFDTLIKINGVGPKLALIILSTLSIDNLRQAVASERIEVLTRVPGIGKKTAEKILLELRDKLTLGIHAVPGDSEADNLNSDVMDALIALGFSVVEVQGAIQSLPNDAPKDLDERIRVTLQLLSR